MPGAMTALLELRDIRKSFGTTVALAGVSFTVRAGSLHALLGENGAGKSTLMHVAGGLVRPDAGEVRVAAPPVALVHQHFTSIPTLSVAENIALAAGWRPAQAVARAADAVGRWGIELPLDAEAGALSVGLRQRLEIAKALARSPSVLLLDEPTGVLTPPEVEWLFGLVERFRSGGGGVALITHKLDEALAYADTVTILNRGVTTLQWRRDAGAPLPRSTMLGAMLGEERALPEGTPARGTPGEPRVQAATLAVAREDGRGLGLRGATLTVRAREVVGVAGVEGNGQRELLRAVAGLLAPAGGTVRTAGALAFIPEDRTTEGLIGEFTLAENLALDPAVPGAGPGVMDHRSLRRMLETLVERYDIRTPAPTARADALSGGNQQKLVVARALAGAPEIVVAENPGRGLDIGAAGAVFRALRAAAAAGAAVLFTSTDLDEVVAYADRVVVAARGELFEVAPGADRATIGRTMMTPEAPGR